MNDKDYPHSYEDQAHAQESAAALKAHHARVYCADHIVRYYPIHKQLNLLRTGTQAEKDKMDVFISACRDWSNGENPDPAALASIEP